MNRKYLFLIIPCIIAISSVVSVSLSLSHAAANQVTPFVNTMSVKVIAGPSVKELDPITMAQVNNEAMVVDNNTLAQLPTLQQAVKKAFEARCDLTQPRVSDLSGDCSFEQKLGTSDSDTIMSWAKAQGKLMQAPEIQHHIYDANGTITGNTVIDNYGIYLKYGDYYYDVLFNRASSVQ